MVVCLTKYTFYNIVMRIKCDANFSFTVFRLLLLLYVLRSVVAPANEGHTRYHVDMS